MSYNFAEKEKEILKFWQGNKIFEKLREKNKSKKRWNFLDGPVTANNPMGVHHAWGRTYKDILQRYFAMKGFDERYQNGFDCQGLWVEVEVEKELGFKNKKDIEVYGIDKFVGKCKERVLKYSAIQTAQSVRLGQWMDWENSYFTMSDENNYAIWHFLKKCHERGYLYKGRDSVPWCPRCGTAISQHEILTEEYKLITHKAVYFKLPITEGKLKGSKFLVWTTTPWTIPANVALAVGKNIDYVEVEILDKYNDNGEALYQNIILAKAIYEVEKPKNILKEYKLATKKGDIKLPEIVKEFKGVDLKGIKYESPFDVLPRVKKAAAENPKTFHTVVLDKDLVTELEGTGIVHIAPGAGEEDFKIGKTENLSVIDVIDESAVYLDGMDELSSKNAKQNPEIIFDYLKNYQNGKFLFAIQNYQHRYPTCWRCKTELVWRVVDEWYISMEKLRKPLEAIVKKINWIPSFGKERELDWIKNMRDWLISKKRYWGLALPIFECECGNFEVIGSKEELQKRAVGVPGGAGSWEKFKDNSPHRPWVDDVKIRCKKCPGRKATEDPRLQGNRDKKGLMSRIKDVGNPWLDAGIVPFSTIKYLSDKPYWKKWFPAQIVCESFPGQFKNWFYSLLVMSAVLEDAAPVKTIFGYASVVDEKGNEMHKSTGNSILLDEALEKAGADPMRWLYAKSNPAENMRFGYSLIEETKRKLLILYNVYAFFSTYVDKKDFPSYAKASEDRPSYAKASEGGPTNFSLKSQNILDKWIISKMDHIIGLVEFTMDKYDIGKSVVAIEDFFINDLSLWYLRRSRKRFHDLSASAMPKALRAGDFGGSRDLAALAENPDRGRKEAIETLYHVLLSVAKIIAPVIPFFAEKMYQALKIKDMPESIHLCDWPSKSDRGQTDLDLEQNIDDVRSIVKLALAERAVKAIKVRQPLTMLTVKNKKSKIRDSAELLELIKDEVNVKEIIFDDSINNEIELDVKITEALREEGKKREVIRIANDLRKEGGYTPLMYITEILSTSATATLFDPGLLKEIRVKEGGYRKIIDKKEIPPDYIEKEVKLEDGKTDIIAIPKISKGTKRSILLGKSNF